MFTKLKRKLTLFNMLIVGIIIFVLALIIFIGSPHLNTQSVTKDMLELALNGPTFSKDSNSLYEHMTSRHNELIYIKLSYDHQILASSISSELPDATLDELIQFALASPDYSGQITLADGTTYPFLKCFFDTNQSTTLVFRDIHHATFSKIAFICELLAILVFSIFIVFLGSSFLSSKALIPIRNAWQKQIDFTADASHELRTPLAAIQTNTELILGNKEETVASQEKWLKNILKETNRMAKLVENLLLLARTDTKEAALESSTFLLNEAIFDALTPLEPLALERQIQLSWDLESNLLFTGDYHRMQQLVVILVDNAIQYMNQPGTIKVYLIEKKHLFQLIVEDTGKGIPAEELPHLFDRFYRVDKARSRNKGGSGLGLSIAKWIVESHGGSITAMSTLNQGTSFIIDLPLHS